MGGGRGRGGGRWCGAGRKKMTKNANFSPRPATKGCCTVAAEDKSLRLCFSVPPPPSFSSSSFSHVRSALSDLLWVFLHSRDRVELPSDSGSAFSPSSSSHLHYEREDLLAIEYNADLSVSIHRDREPSSSRVPLRRGYTYPPSAARRIAARKRRRREEEETGWRGGGGTERDRTLGVFCAWLE